MIEEHDSESLKPDVELCEACFWVLGSNSECLVCAEVREEEED